MNIQVAVIGGGASGLAAAALLARAGVRTVVLEREVRVGKKLLVTGNGRCNLGNTSIDLAKYHGEVELARQVFTNWQGSERFFNELGLVCRSDSEGWLYPYSNTANSVLDTLRAKHEHLTFMTDTPCVSLTRSDDVFVINGDIRAERVIWACGNAPLTLLQRLGHTVVELFPALCPIMTDAKRTRPLKGLRVRSRARAIVNETVLSEEQGEVQFGENSLSGICIMNLSRWVREYGDSMQVSLDIAPEFSIVQLREWGLNGLFHSRIVSVLEREPIETVKDWRFPVVGVAPRNKAQIISGGIPARELQSDLESRVCAGLYVIGEAVNIDGDCGGYNLEWAWASSSCAVHAILIKKLT
ncbi:MAG: NAD(P)/FAD-dependent oxidoreductase [Oscillospiraceae bacterium]|nr:NAD(P)/FAD-dependent oxidoreductase [Oscillospiraceae bacterium]